MKSFKFILTLCLFSLFSNLHIDAKVTEVKYSFLGNYNAKMNIPLSDEKMPAIIYVYDEYVDFVGEVEARRKGYDIYEYMKVFEQWGYISFFPINRLNRVNSIKGAIRYLKNHDKVDPNKIHVIGVSQGAFLSLLAIDGFYQPSSLTLIAPIPIHAKGILSLPQVLRRINEIHVPLLLITGKMEMEWKRHYGELISKILTQNNIPFRRKTYMKHKWWFWKPEHPFMQDILDFMKEYESFSQDDKSDLLDLEEKSTYAN